MLAHLVALVMAVPPTGFTSSFERINLVRTSSKEPTVVVDALGASITLTEVRLAGALVSEICPKAETRKGGSVVLSCVNRRMWAGLLEDKRGMYLDLRSLRGLPWDGETALPLHAWPMRALGIKDECPGRLDATQGECLLAEGKWDEAEVLFKRGRAGPDSNFCYLRLGDLAVRKGDPEAAVNLYAFVPPVGPIGRVARSRLCDLTGACMNEKSSAVAGDTFAIDEPMKTELEMMTWRREAFMGREGRIMAAFAQKLADDPTVCRDAVPMCQKMLMLGLQLHDDDARTAALQGWLNEYVRRGPYQLELALAAAHAAEDLGAPGFAANVLAATSVPKAQLNPHLLRVAELYLHGRDFVRANVILEYAEQKLGKDLTSRAGWAGIRKRINAFAHPDLAGAQAAEKKTQAAALSVSELENNVQLAAELARAASVRSRSMEPEHAP